MYRTRSRRHIYDHFVIIFNHKQKYAHDSGFARVSCPRLRLTKQNHYLESTGRVARQGATRARQKKARRRGVMRPVLVCLAQASGAIIQPARARAARRRAVKWSSTRNYQFDLGPLRRFASLPSCSSSRQPSPAAALRVRGKYLGLLRFGSN